MAKRLIRFDWAIKKLLKDKANFNILEGFLTVLLDEPIIIEKILDSESNKDTENDKHNRVDILVKDQRGELIIIEVQNSKEYDYFHRMIYGTSKVISEYIQQGEPYANVKKVISITIAYFDLGQGEDYVYHGTNKFYGIHKDDVLTLADQQKELYEKQTVHEIFPEYWIIKADKYDGRIENKLDEWIYFLKNSEIKEEFTAPGLKEAQEKLDQLRMSEPERRAYQRYLKRLMDIASADHTRQADIQKLRKESKEEGREEGRQEGREEGRQEGKEEGRQEGKGIGREERDVEIVMRMHVRGQSVQNISELTGLSETQIETIIENKN